MKDVTNYLIHQHTTIIRSTKFGKVSKLPNI